jgi:hypothetical protein
VEQNYPSQNTKLMYQALVQSILLYGAETWTLNTQQGKNYWQLRWIFGDNLLENQGKERSEMAPLERSWSWEEHFRSN